MALPKHVRVKGKLPNGTVKDRKLYRRWCLIRRRCYDRKFISYPEYGAKGITVCDEWLCDYVKFQEWALSNGWNPSLTIDRIDSKKGYSPDNCRWATPLDQSRNRGYRKLATFDGVTKNVSDWADERGMNRSAVYARIKNGRTPEDALSTPIVDNRHPDVTIDGVSMSIYAWAKKVGVGRSWMYCQMSRYGRTAEDIIRKALKKGNNK